MGVLRTAGLSLLSFIWLASTPLRAADSAVSEQQISAGIDLFNASGLSDLLLEQFTSLPSAPPDPSKSAKCVTAEQEEMQKLTPELVSNVGLAVGRYYAGYFSQRELQTLSEFYRGPVGVRYKSAVADATTEVMRKVADAMRKSDLNSLKDIANQNASVDPMQSIDKKLGLVANRMTQTDLAELQTFFTEGPGKKYADMDERKSASAAFGALLFFAQRAIQVNIRLEAEHICP
jgi:hypothetical protein